MNYQFLVTLASVALGSLLYMAASELIERRTGKTFYQLWRDRKGRQ